MPVVHRIPTTHMMMIACTCTHVRRYTSLVASAWGSVAVMTAAGFIAGFGGAWGEPYSLVRRRRHMSGDRRY